MERCMQIFLSLALLTGCAVICSGQTIAADRLNCTSGAMQPVVRVNTTGRLDAFRAYMRTITAGGRSVFAFVVGSQNAHNSQPTAYDKRRGYISGFEGSAGTAVITNDEAALWTDGRYFDEADENLDCNWILMKEGLPGTPTIAEWLNTQLGTPGATVGIDRTLVTNGYFLKLSQELSGFSNALVLSDVTSNRNPVDQTWPTPERPAQPNATINALSIDFAGVTWQTKLADLRAKMTENGASTFVVTALDETAWLFNLRGSDVDYKPFFLSYAVVQANSAVLYILEKDARLTATPSDNETSVTLATHLNTGNTGSCAGKTGQCVEVKTYDQTSLENDIRTLAASGKVWITKDANYAIYDTVSVDRMVANSPLALAKSQKNAVEREGMTNSYNRDSVALIKFLAFLEKEIADGQNQWTEVSVKNELNKRRSELQYSRGLSFETISGYGGNGAIIHYRTADITDKPIGTDSFFLLDSGGQYLDGTTDVTRTMHYGTPTAYQKECYTRVFMGAASLATLRWPEGLYGFQIDSLARAALWEAGLVYNHGTGHGIGAYLGVHEGPGKIYKAHSLRDGEETIRQYQFYSDEPGYYETNNFGVRLETIVMVNPITPKYSTANLTFYEFTPITLVPFETKLIDFSLLNTKQIDWLNSYNKKIQDDILPLLSGDAVAIAWVNARTQKVDTSATCEGNNNNNNAATTVNHSFVLWMAALISAVFVHHVL